MKQQNDTTDDTIYDITYDTTSSISKKWINARKHAFYALKCYAYAGRWAVCMNAEARDSTHGAVSLKYMH
jgi:hypothetical protein